MDQALQLMPARCNRCGALFDLKYDLGSDERLLTSEAFSRTVSVAARTKLCWNCRA